MQEMMDKIVAKIAAMPKEEFDQLIEKYRNDPIAIAIREMQEFLVSVEDFGLHPIKILAN